MGWGSMLYPQQNVVRNKLDLSGIWNFQVDPDKVGESQGWYKGLSQPRPIAVPGSWNEQYADLYNYLGLAWYSLSTYIPQKWRSERVFLRVGSACYFSTVYLNGNKVGGHEGGHLPFAFEITDYLRWDEENRIAISVENELKPSRVPAGNMDSPLLSVASYPKTTYDFFPFAGIHRPVVLYSVPQTFIGDITVITDIEETSGIVKVSARLNQAVNVQGAILLQGAGYISESFFGFRNGIAVAELTVPNAEFWSDQNPFLYDLTLTTDEDQYSLKIGIRTVAVEKGKVLLNGKPVQLNGFGRHEDFFVSGKGLNLPLLVKDYQLMRWTGANSYRTSHYPYSEEDKRVAHFE